MVTSREVFSSAPLAMVVAETRFSYSPRLASEEGMAQALAQVERFAPVREAFKQESVELQPGADGPSARTAQVTNGMLARSLDLQTTVAVTPQSVTVAMSGTAYSMFEDSLRLVVEAACAGVADMTETPIVTRAGLRYPDEVRVPEPPSDIAEWSRWISPELLGAAGYLRDVSGVAQGMRSTWHYSLPGDRQVVLNYGPFFGVGVVGPEHPFHKPGPSSLMFVLDLDCSWTPPLGAAQLTVPELLARYDELHSPAKAVFAAAVTDEARSLFRGETQP